MANSTSTRRRLSVVLKSLWPADPTSQFPKSSNRCRRLAISSIDREAQLGVLESVLMGQNLKDRVYPQGRPVNSGWISSYFGKRTDPFTGKPANHTGIDFAGKLG